jgi:capsid assembly protease
MKWLMLSDEIERIEALLSEHVSTAELEGVIHAVAPMKMGSGGVASIRVEGPILNRRSAMLDFFGATYSTYQDIRSQIAEAKERGANRIDIHADSPGGTVDGLYETMDAIKNAGIETRTIGGPTVASAMYMLASQTDSIVAENDLSMIGSVGVAYKTSKRPGERVITNTDSPKKRPDVDTDEGAAVIREEVDGVYQVLAEKIAIGRGVSPEIVKRDYGQGAMMTARTANQRGLIDSIGVEKIKPTAKSAANQGDKMDAKQLKNEHPDVYAAVFEAGQTDERERVCAHLVLADGSGDYDAAHASIKDGSAVNQLTTAHHMAAAMKRNMSEARVADNPDDVEAVEEDRSGGEEVDDKAFVASWEKDHEGYTMEVIR